MLNDPMLGGSAPPLLLGSPPALLPLGGGGLKRSPGSISNDGGEPSAALIAVNELVTLNDPMVGGPGALILVLCPPAPAPMGGG